MLKMKDNFSDPHPLGQVVGQPNAEGIVRGGRDVEGVMAVDQGALRIRPLLHPGWGRSALAYGPFPRQPGLTFAVYMLNGHNTSQSGELTQSVLRRLGRWALGSGTMPLGRRLWNWTKNGHKSHFLRQVQHWYWLNRHYKNGQLPVLDENMAVGWFADEAPDPMASGTGFVMHALGANNGELWLQANGKSAPVLSGCQNVPIFYVVVLRQKGAVYYAASLPGTVGLGTLPQLRPLGIDVRNEDANLYAVVTQSVLGQIGFSVDSRVYGAEVTAVPTLENWYTTAHAADPFTGAGSLHKSAAEVGGIWQVSEGAFSRTEQGLQAQAANSAAWLQTDQPVGLLHLLATPQQAETAVSLFWRVQDDENKWRLRLENGRCQAAVQEQGVWQSLSEADGIALVPGQAHAIQILDDGHTIHFMLDGAPLLPPLVAEQFAQASGVGLALADSDTTVRDFEIHPRSVPIPAEVSVPIPWLPETAVTTVNDSFEGTAGDLDGRQLGHQRQSLAAHHGHGSFSANGTRRCPGRRHLRAAQPRPHSLYDRLGFAGLCRFAHHPDPARHRSRAVGKRAWRPPVLAR